MKTVNRDDFSAKTVSILKQRAAFICSNPSCNCLTIAPSEVDKEKVIFNGVVSHIASASPGGPRYNAAMTQEERSGINNAIFLCSNCSVLIDKNNGIDHPVELLNAWKLKHERWVKDNLNKRINNEPSATIINVTSTNQSGGITAGVVNIGEPQRRMSPQLKTDLDKLFANPSEKVAVLYVAGNTEALKFATEIKDYLVSKDFRFASLGSFTRSPEIYGLKVEKSRHGEGTSILVGYIPHK